MFPWGYGPAKRGEVKKVRTSTQLTFLRAALPYGSALHLTLKSTTGQFTNKEACYMKSFVQIVIAACALFSIHMYAYAQVLPTLFIIGDSTVKNHSKSLQGWGDPIAKYFDTSKFTSALGGRSSRTFQTEGLWDKVYRNTKDYGGWAAQVATAENVDFVDSNRMTADKYDLLGFDVVKSRYFPGDHTHTDPSGAMVNAASIVEGLLAQPNCPLKTYILKNSLTSDLPDTSAAQSNTNAQSRSPLALRTNYMFTFGTEKDLSGELNVSPTAEYSDTTGYGFEPGSLVENTRNGISSDRPFFFSASVPEGNYRVNVVLGTKTSGSDTTVKAELRRLMVENVRTNPGQSVTRTFIVNVRIPEIKNGGEVHLKARERTTEWRDWDNKLTLEFSGHSPSVHSISIDKVDTPTLFVLGDSTVCDQPAEPYSSWGQMLPRFLNSGIAVANYAESGETLLSTLRSRRLEKVLSVMKPGDSLLIQFGHNDQKERGVGVGAFTTYTDELKTYVARTRAVGGFPILVTPVNRQMFGPDGKVTNSLGDYPEAVRLEATEDNVPLIDLNKMSKTLYEAIGERNIKVAFATGDNTHHNDYGSYELAKCVVAGIRQNNLTVAKYIIRDFRSFDPNHPDSISKFNLPADPQTTTTRPLGS